jgi:hypothetical protein
MKRTVHDVYRPLVACALLELALPLRAADITWSNPSGGDWTNAANWNPNQVPGAADKAVLALGATVTVSVDTVVSNLDLSSGALGSDGSSHWLGDTPTCRHSVGV